MKEQIKWVKMVYECNSLTAIIIILVGKFQRLWLRLCGVQVITATSGTKSAEKES